MSEQRSQIKPKKIILGFIFGAVVMIASLLVLLPALMNTDAIKAKIIYAASQAIDGQVDFKRIRLSLLPRPHAIISQGNMAIQNSVYGKWMELSVVPRLGALVVGRLEIANLTLKQPDFELRLPLSFPQKTDEPTPFQKSDDLRQQIREGIGVLSAVINDMSVAIEGGQIKVLDKNRAPLKWQDITARLEVANEQMAVDLTCSSSFFQKVVWNGELNFNTLNLNGKITLKGLAPHPFMTYWLPDAGFGITDGRIDLTLQFQSQGWSNWQGDFESRTSLLKVQHNTYRADIGPALLNGRFNFSPSQMALQIDRLDLDHPQLSLVGKLLVDSSEAAGVHLQIAGQNADVNAVRATALSLGGHIPDIRDVFDIVKGGQVPTIKVEVQVKDWADLSAFERWRIDGEMTDGTIFIPEVNLDLTDTYGHAIIENGILTAENVRANYRKTQGRQGSLKIGLMGEVKPFHLDIDVIADLTELPSILNRLIDNAQVKSELSRIEHLTGMGTGKLILGENLDDINVQIDVSEFDLKTHYNRLPHPLGIKGGNFQLKGNEIQIGDLSAQMQNTHFSKMSGRVSFDHAVEFEVQTGSGTIVLSEIYPWLKKHVDLAKPLKTIESVNGLIAISALYLKGPFLRPSAWRFNISGDIQNLAVKATRLPKTLVLSRGQFKLAPESLKLSKSRAQLLDFQTDFSVQINGYMEGGNKLNYSGSGKMGPNFTQWLTHETKIPAQYHLKPPIDFKRLDVDWSRSGEIAVVGSMATSNGPTVMADMRFAPDEIDIRKLSIQDDASDAEFSLNHKSKAKMTDLSFKGILAKTTLDQFWKKNRFLEGTVKGDVQAHIDLEHPLNSVVKGNLEAHQVFLPFKAVGPLRIDDTVLSASGNKVKVHEADIDWLGNQFELDGHLTFEPGSISLEIIAAAEEIDAGRLETLFKDDDKKTSKDETSSQSIFQGTVQISAERLKYGFYTWTPYHATVMLEKNGLSMQVNEARICGIETLGTVKFSKQGVWMEIISSSQPAYIQHVIGCLTGKSTSEIIEGQFQKNGTLNTEGKTADELLRNLKGDIEITIQDGRVYNIGRVGTFTNIFSFLKINRLVENDVPDLNSNDFLYKLLSTKFYIQDGKFILTEGYINGKSLNIIAAEGELNLFNQTLDIKLLVSPFTTTDTVINKIPLIRQIFQGRLIAIPVRVKGDISNPQVRVLSPSAFSSRTMGIIKRTLKVPVKIIDPVLTDRSNLQETDR
jgi:AsmA-like C-terminal region/Domain of Unknown Function (DUF748)